MRRDTWLRCAHVSETLNLFVYTSWIGYLGHDTLFLCKKTKEVESEV